MCTVLVRARACVCGLIREKYRPPCGEGFPYPENQSAGLRPALTRLCACFACGEPQRAREQRPAAQTRRLRARAASAAEAGRVRAERKIRPPPRGGPPSVMLGSGSRRGGGRGGAAARAARSWKTVLRA